MHRRVRLVEVGPQRVHRALAARRRGAAARRPLRPARAARAGRARARRRALHGADRVPRDRQARGAAPDPRAARARRGRRGARPRRARRPGTTRPGCGSATATARRRPASSPACRSASRRAPARWAGRCPACGSSVDDGELVLDPATDPTFFLRYLGEEPHAGPVADRRPRARRRGRLPLLRGPRRRRDRLRRLPDRPVRGRVGARRPPGGRRRRASSPRPTTSAAASSAPSSSCATGHAPSDALARELQEHVKAETAPYKYPRIVDFAAELPRTPSGKLRRAALRLRISTAIRCLCAGDAG